MNWNEIEGDWKQLSGSIKKQWGKLTDNDLKILEGKKDLLVGKIQEYYGVAEEEAETQVEKWAVANKTMLDDNKLVTLGKDNQKKSGGCDTCH